MNGVRVPRCLVLAAVLLGAACSSDGGTSPVEDDDSGECDEVIGESCDCEGGEESETICADGEVICDCAPVDEDDDEGDDDEEDASTGDDDDGDDDAPAKDAGGGARDTGPARPTADTGTAKPTPDAAADSGGGMDGPPPVTGGSDPQIPEATGECPEFKSGTITVMGTSGISMVAGAKKEGTGSLVFYWHGTGSSWGGESLGSFPRSVQSQITGQGGVIFAINGSQRTGGDCSGTGTFGKDDFKIADLVAACAVKNHGVNPRRIYTTGCSAGGLQAGCMALTRPNYIAAAVPNSGGSIAFGTSLSGAKSIPAVMTMYGPPASDTVVGLAFESSSKALMDVVKRAGGFAVGCNHGGRHCGAPAPLYESGWKFMQDHPYGTKPSPYMSALPSGFHSSCKIH
jgi:hypothetical protein